MGVGGVGGRLVGGVSGMLCEVCGRVAHVTVCLVGMGQCSGSVGGGVGVCDGVVVEWGRRLWRESVW